MEENKRTENPASDNEVEKKRSLEEELAETLKNPDSAEEKKESNENTSIRDANDIHHDDEQIEHDHKDHKNVFETVGSGFLHIIRGYWVVFKEWVKNITISKSERWAMAICLLLALTVWIYVINVDDTGHQESVDFVLVELDGTTTLKNFNMSVIGGYNNAVTVTLRGKRSDIGNLTAEDIYAYVDVSEIRDVGRHSLPIKVDLPQNSTLVAIEPSTISVQVDENSIIDVGVEVKMGHYILDAAYSLGEPIPAKKSVTVTGPKSVLETIEYAAVTIDAGNIMSSVNFVNKVQLFDEFDNVIDNPYVKCDISEISVYVPVTMTKSVAVNINFVNGVNPNFIYRVDPAEIILTGDPQVLNSMNSIFVFDVTNDDLANIEANRKPIVKHINNPKLPDGVKMSDEAKEKGINISIELKPEDKTEETSEDE